MSDKEIKVIVDRFLSWRLPEDFSPDAGISFKKVEHPISDLHPIGTNLFTATQAEAMIRYILDEPTEERTNGKQSNIQKR